MISHHINTNNERKRKLNFHKYLCKISKERSILINYNCLGIRLFYQSVWNRVHLFFYKQLFFFGRPKNCLAILLKSPQKIVYKLFSGWSIFGITNSQNANIKSIFYILLLMGYHCF